MRDSSTYCADVAVHARLRERVVALRHDAAYWRRRGRRETAVEIERVAAFVDELTQELIRRLMLE